MVAGVRQAGRRLGKVGITFLIALALLLAFSFTGNRKLILGTVAALLLLATILVFRAVRFATRRSLWSLRNRLLFVYALFGVIPVFLLLAIFSLSAWAFMSEMAIYLASSELDRRLNSVHAAAETIRNLSVSERHFEAAVIAKAYNQSFPGIVFYIKDESGENRYPADTPPIHLKPGWKDVHGLLFRDDHFYGWSHYQDGKQEVTVLAPLGDEMIANLVPNLGVIALVEPPKEAKRGARPITVGSLQIPSARKPKVSLDQSGTHSGGPEVGRIPPPVNRLDIQIAWPAARSHFHWDTPGILHPGALWVQSRPSAVLRTFFYEAEFLRGLLFDVLVAIAILFLFVELLALVTGVSLSRRITRAVYQLYQGTRHVTRGDFRHRIPVHTRDQLGELAESFNQMTGNVERLLSVEKEEERLLAEIEIAREVQSQLYPREAPPSCGLKLTVRCDPARMVSGDYYDYQVVGGQKFAFAIGDVAGKGIAAALLMATLQAAFRAQVSQYQPGLENESTELPKLDAATVVSKLNKQIYATTALEKYATFFFALYDEGTRTLTYTNAGHLSPLLIRGGEIISLDSNGTVIGLFPSPKYNESRLTLHTGDLLICYTDGITEPENVYGEMFGEERLLELVKSHAHEDDCTIVRLVFEAVHNWTGNPELHDDMTLLLAREAQTAR